MFESALLTELWSHGIATVQDLTRETAGYCARYILKKQLGRDAKYVNADGVMLKPEYSAMSLKPGVGAGWFDKFGRDVFPHDFVVADGTKYQTPRYYDRIYKRCEDNRMDEVEWARIERARKALPDQSTERRVVREQVHEARMRNFKRSLD